MIFNKLLIFHFMEALPSADALAEALARRPFRPCSSLEVKSLGWVPPIGLADAPLARSLNGATMLCLRTEEKLLPGSVIAEVAAERIAEAEESTGRALRSKERNALRDEVTQDLLPRAFTHSRRTYGLIDRQTRCLILNASGKAADEFNAVLRQCLGSLPIVPLSTCERPELALTQWLGEDGPPSGVTLESECELRSPEENGGIVRCRRHDLGAPEIQTHLEAGKECVKLAFTWQDRVALTLEQSLAVPRFQLLDLALAERDNAEADSAPELFDADFAILLGELRGLIPALCGWFGGANLKEAA